MPYLFMIAKLKKNKRPHKNSWESTFFSILLSVLLLIVFGFLVVSNIRISQKRVQFDLRISSFKKEIQALEEENQKLKAQISQIGRESYLEKEARERFNLKKPGEEVVVFTKEKTEPVGEQRKEKNFWQKILEIFSRD